MVCCEGAEAWGLLCFFRWGFLSPTHLAANGKWAARPPAGASGSSAEGCRHGGVGGALRWLIEQLGGGAISFFFG